jgi:glycosyltransferase involved in cell wall biosynthesis
LARADVLVLPYRRITTSGTALLGLGAGLPVVVPDLPALADLPDGAVFRFRRDGTGPTLAEVLATVASTPPEVLLAMGRRGRQHAGLTSWASIARQTRDALAALVAAP